MPDFNDVLESQIPRLRRYSRALTRDTQRADDLVQDTLVRALMKQDRWEPGTNLRAWLFTLMHNQYVNNVRRANREAGTIDIDDVSSSLVATTDPTASRQLYELERGVQLRGRREDLGGPGRDRTVAPLAGPRVVAPAVRYRGGDRSYSGLQEPSQRWPEGGRAIMSDPKQIRKPSQPF